ncbi:unnamed protein product, partial [Mesorhabditis spiculigera]
MEMSKSGGESSLGAGASADDVAKFLFDLSVLCQSTNVLPNPITTLQLRLVGPQGGLNYALDHYTAHDAPYKFDHPHVLDNYRLGHIRADGAAMGLNLRSCQVTDKVEFESRMHRFAQERMNNANSTLGSIDMQRAIAQFNGVPTLSPALKQLAINNRAADDHATTTYTGTASRRSVDKDSSGSTDSKPKQRNRRTLRAK